MYSTYIAGPLLLHDADELLPELRNRWSLLMEIDVFEMTIPEAIAGSSECLTELLLQSP